MKQQHDEQQATTEDRDETRSRTACGVSAGSVLKFETRVTRLSVMPTGAPIFDELSTWVEIADEARGEFVEVVQGTRHECAKIRIEREEWPALRAAIDRMIKECRL